MSKGIKAENLAACLKNGFHTVCLKYRILKINGVWKITVKRLVGLNFSKALNAKLIFCSAEGKWLSTIEQEFKVSFMFFES